MQQEAIDTTFEDTLISLLSLFNQCKTYAERLSFWEEHDLTEHLYYYLPLELRCWYPVNYPGLSLSTLSIAPFTEDEVRQFIDWALRVRPMMKSAPVSAEKLRSDFEQQYQRIERKVTREAFLTECREKAERLVEDKYYRNTAIRSMHLQEIGLNESLYAQFLFQIDRGQKPDLTNFICIGRIKIDWRLVDTYLYTKAQHEYAVFLERINFDKYDAEQVSSAAKPVDNLSELVQIKDETKQDRPTQPALALFYHYCHEKRCIAPFESGKMQQSYKAATDPYKLAWKPFQQFYNLFNKSQKDRLDRTNRSALKAAIRMLKDYPEALELAMDELRIAETRNPIT